MWLTLTLMLAPGCDRPKDPPGDDDDGPTGTTPTGSFAVRAAGEAVPLSFALDVDVDGAARVEVAWVARDDGHTGASAFDLPGPVDNLPLLGFREDRTYDVTVTIDGIAAPPVEVVTPEVVLAYRSLQVLTAEPERMDGHQTLLPLWGGGFAAPQAVVVDEEGEVVYLLSVDDRLIEARTHADGLVLLVGREAVEIREVGWLGETRRSFISAADPDAVNLPDSVTVPLPGRIHHDVAPQEDGGYIVLSKTLRQVDDFPIDYDDPTVRERARISADVVARFDAAGAMLWSYDLSQLLDARRLGFDSLSAAMERDAYEWGHSNALWVEADGRVGVSLRHQDELVLVDPVDGEVDWVLGTLANRDPKVGEPVLTPIGDTELPYHSHAGRRTADGLYTVFDNGNWRYSPGDIPAANLPPETEQYSRLAGFEVDEQAMTVRQVYSLDLADTAGAVYCDGLGDHDRLPNGNVLGTFGKIIVRDGAYTPTHGGGESESRIVEFDPEGNEVWHLLQETDPAVQPDGFATWRAERVTFPGQVLP